MVSVAPTLLYAKGGFYDEAMPPAAHTALINAVHEVFPAYAYTRPMAELHGPHEAVAELHAFFAQHVAPTFRVGAGVASCEIHDAWVYDNAIYIGPEEGPEVVFESWRPIDRSIIEPLPRFTDRQHDRVTIEKECFYLGSPGSGNYGHWLVDDLPRLAALQGRRELPVILLPSYGGAIDRAKADTISTLFEGNNLTIRFVNPKQPLRLKRNLYVTPPTYHPVLKSPEALGWVHRVVGPKLASRSWAYRQNKIYISRGQGHARRFKSESDLERTLARKGFAILNPARMTALEQARKFQDADLVVGVMGAAMVNTVYCKPGVRIVHIAPAGWNEPFYWDLAAALGHDYVAIYGPREPSELPPSHWNFDVGVTEVKRLL